MKLCDTLHVISKITGKFLCLFDLFLFFHILTCHFVYVVSVLFEVSCAMCVKIIVIQDMVPNILVRYGAETVLVYQVVQRHIPEVHKL
jgi:hypothetical protein